MSVSLVILACATCFGSPDSSQTHAQNMGILFLLGLTGVMLAGFATLFVYFWRRARRCRGANAPIAELPKELPEAG